MIVNDMCNKYKTTNNLDFWNVSIDTTNTDTNIKLKEYTDDSNNEIKKRLNITSNRDKRLEYNRNMAEDVKKNYRYSR